jgi:cytochrome c oxidase subunit 2
MTLVIGLALSSILLAACGENSPTVLQTYGPVADSESFVFWAILIIATLVFVVVEGILVYSIFRYRERPGQPEPRQVHGNLVVEAIWTFIPLVVLFIVLFFTIRGLFEVAPGSALSKSNKTINVQAVGHQWWWEFYYEDYKITTADTMVIPANATIQVKLFSNNVIHSFWVPALTGKTDLVPGHNNEKWFKANNDAIGKTFLGICAEYCGTQHGNMRFAVKVENDNNFQTWVSTQQQAAVTPASGSLAAQGKEVFMGTCAGCHGIVGANIEPKSGEGYGFVDPMKTCNVNPSATECKVGPNLTHFGSRDTIAGGVLQWDSASCDPQDPQLFEKCNLAKWIQHPGEYKPGSAMQGATDAMTEEQIRQVIAYLESLK